MRSVWISELVVFFLLFTCSSCNSQHLTGCTDPLANNYDPDATINDGSCTYDPVSVSPQQSSQLSDQLNRTSGLILWDGNLWTQNDHADTTLYGLNSNTGEIQRVYTLAGVKNIDWEEISQDRDYIYIGDLGNNLGNRRDLHILRINKNSLLEENPVIDTIWFNYSDQIDFSIKEAYQTDFDCEAMIVGEDSIYLFTKQWISAQTSIYRLPKTPGIFAALKMNSYDVQGLVTGATYLESKHLVVLCGYSGLLYPFITLLYDFQDHDFFSGNIRKITVSLPFHQIEGIASQNGLIYHISNESFSLQGVVSTPPKLHVFDLSFFLEEFLTRSSPNGAESKNQEAVSIYPNPVNNHLTVQINQRLLPVAFRIYDMLSRMISQGILTDEFTGFDIKDFEPGQYILAFGNRYEKIFRIMKVQ